VNPVATPANLAASATRPQLLTLCRHDGVDEPLRGQIEAYDRSGYERTLNIVPLESYLQGVVPAESSASWGLDGTTVGAPQGEPWGFQALEAQAVAARSYALAYAAAGGWNGYADICDTDACQAYVGATYETAVSNAAVTDTAGTVRVASGATYNKATIVSTRFSASSGGWTAPSTFPAVRDLGDSCVVPGNPLECNPNHTWSSVVEARVINRHFPAIGRLLRIRVTVRNHDGALGGRALEVGLTGTKGAVLVTGDALASALGLRSDWFAVAHVTRVGAPLTVPTTVPTTTVPTTTVPTSTGVFGATGVSGTTGVSGVTGVSGATGSTGVSGTTGPLAPAT
jgi:peptidoglycan hydrolase-like amidase